MTSKTDRRNRRERKSEQVRSPSVPTSTSMTISSFGHLSPRVPPPLPGSEFQSTLEYRVETKISWSLDPSEDGTRGTLSSIVNEKTRKRDGRRGTTRTVTFESLFGVLRNHEQRPCPPFPTVGGPWSPTLSTRFSFSSTTCVKTVVPCISLGIPSHPSTR